MSTLSSDDVYSLWLTPVYASSGASSSRRNASLGPGQILPSSLASSPQPVNGQLLQRSLTLRFRRHVLMQAWHTLN